MKAPTLVAMKAIFDSDPARTAADRQTLLRTLGLTDAAGTQEPADKILSFEEAAQRLHRSPRAVHLLAKRGILRKAKHPGFQRCSGVLASDLDKLLAGMVAEKQAV